jgi:hypothetical protein
LRADLISGHRYFVIPARMLGTLAARARPAPALALALAADFSIRVVKTKPKPHRR